jgi:hypothetical protein
VTDIEERHHVAINYEENCYVSRRGPFSFTYQVPSSPSREDMAAILRSLLGQWDASGFDERFRVVRSGTVFNIIQIGRRTAAGAVEVCQPVLDTTLQFRPNTRGRNTLEAILDLVNQLRSVTGLNIDVGGMPTNFLSQAPAVELKGTLTARSALAELLRGMPVSWHLGRDSAMSPPLYSLDVRTIRE